MPFSTNLTLRENKTVPLTWVEGDNNFKTLMENTVVLNAEKQPANTKLTTLATAVWAANQLQYQTGVGTVANTLLTEFARSLLDDTDAAAARTTLVLNNVNNTSDLNKPISTATQEALDLISTDIGTALDGKQDLNSKLTAISSLTWAVNQLMYSTGASTVAMAALTAYGRDVLATVDAPAMRTLIGLDGQSLLAINSLTGVDNGVPFFNTATTMQTSASTAFGRGLWNLADAQAARTAIGATVTGSGLITSANPAAARTVLELGTAAQATVTTSSTDSTAGRLLKVADFGLGASSLPNIASSAINSLRTNGTYYADAASGIGGLPVAQDGYLTSIIASATYGKQQYSTLSLDATYERFLVSNVWSAWGKLYKSTNILGTVSQTSGVPTGSVIERGGNGNGEFVKFADGTLICHRYLTQSIGLTASYGTGYYNATIFTWVYPFPYTSIAPALSVVCHMTGRIVLAATSAGETLTGAGFFFYDPSNSSNTATAYIRLTAIGRWF